MVESTQGIQFRNLSFSMDHLDRCTLNFKPENFKQNFVSGDLLMKITTFVFMIIILALIWGGFLYSLIIALKKETQKRNQPTQT